MEGEPASPRSKLLEQIYVRGSDTVIRISDDAVIVKTTREGGIRLPDDLEHPKDAATPVVQATSEDTTSHDAITGEGASGYTASSSDRLVTEHELNTLAFNIRDDWKTFALCYLNLPATDVERSIRDNSTNEDQVFSVLLLWRSREGKHATVENLIGNLSKAVDMEKWEFLIKNDPLSEECSETGGKDITKIETGPTSGFDSEGEDDLPPISLVSSVKEEDVTHGGGTPLDENEPIVKKETENVYEIRNERRREQDGTLEDIERLSAVYTGFAEENKDQLTSIGIAMGDTLQKILRLDHENKKLKTEMAQLREEKELAEALLASSQQDERPPPKRQDQSEKQTNPKKYSEEAFLKQRNNYLKLKRHLKEAIEANREWDSFSRKKRDDHNKEMNEKNAIIKSLEERLEIAESSSSDQNRQMDSILNATESQVTDMQTELVRLRTERSELKERLRRLIEEKRQVEKLSKDLLKQNALSGGKTEKKWEQRRTENVVQSADVNLHEGSVAPMETFQETIKLAQQAKAPPNDGYHARRIRSEKMAKKAASKPAQAQPDNTPEDDILFLKEQVLQYRKDFEKERKDREKAAGELESLRRELEDTRLMLDLQRDEYKDRKTGGTTKYGGAQPEQYKKKKTGFPYMDPDEVEGYYKNSGLKGVKTRAKRNV
ncbi:uncharacterized protein [Apostichopus japonicus]|uniref:uncharacterized protein isoform X3 n=1 Tax=Stichopus japonicus TaxID=307972 RepID=UPI003AB7E35C